VLAILSDFTEAMGVFKIDFAGILVFDNIIVLDCRGKT